MMCRQIKEMYNPIGDVQAGKTPDSTDAMPAGRRNP